LAAFSATAAPGPARELESITPVRAFRSFDKRTAAGLPQSTPTSLLQDERGILWIATLDGLATFDGTEIRRIASQKDAPEAGAVFSLGTRRSGGLYAGSSRGVHIFDGASWRLLPSRAAVSSIAEEGPAGPLWIADQEGRVWKSLDPIRGTPWKLQDSPAIPLPSTAVAPSEEGIWISGKTGVARARGETVQRLADSEALPTPVTAIRVASDGVCWIAAGEGRIFFRPRDSTRWNEIPDFGWQGGRIRCISEDRRGRIWMGGNDGRVCFGTKDSSWTEWGPENGLRTSAIGSILADREGTLWLGFNGSGLLQWLGEGWSHRTVWDERDRFLPRVQVFGISGTSSGGFLAAVFNRGIWRSDGRTMQALGRSDGLAEDVLIAVEPSPGVIWAGTRFGIYESKGGSRFRKVFEIPSGFVSDFLRGSDGRWLAATSTLGIFRQTAEGWKPVELWNRSLPDLNVKAFLRRGNGEFWVGTTRGLSIFRGDTAVNLTRKDGIPESVNSLLEADGRVWVGGTEGISVGDVGQWRRFRPSDGLPDETIYSLARAADGSVWAGGSAGVGRFVAGRWRMYDVNSGLIEDECNSKGLWVAPDGTVLVGTMASLARFDPDVPELPRPPLACIWSQVPASDPASRAAREARSVHLSWIAPWLSADPIEYRYRVTRLSPEWISLKGRHDLNFNSLEPGWWTVEVEARRHGEAGAAWTAPIEARFFVRPRFWETLPAQAGVAVLALLMLALLVRLRTRQLAARARWLNDEVARRTAELEESHRELQGAHQRLEELARKDALTGLYNRRMADERLQEIFSAGRRHPAPISLLLFDLDNLKLINDRGGHDVGDSVLKAVASVCREVFRETDVLVRYGGDEFLVVFPETGEEEALGCANRFLSALNDLPSVTVADAPLPVNVSGGLASSTDSVRTSPAELIDSADRALYFAKRAGRNRIVTFSSLDPA
jgi:diguanylate cyclase (GGDEF)-like protein